jgi:hypothetical protein
MAERIGRRVAKGGVGDIPRHFSFPTAFAAHIRSDGRLMVWTHEIDHWI